MIKNKLIARYWHSVVPLLGLAVACTSGFVPAPQLLPWFSAALLVGCVLGAVVHAETIAQHIGEPYGGILLSVAVTIIEIALIVSAMTSGGPDKAELARDTVLASVMIVCNGVTGLCLLVGAIRHGELGFRIRGASSALSVLAVLSVLTLIVPNYTSRRLGPMLTDSQLAFAGGSALLLYGVFVFVQTVRHREDFVPAQTAAPACADPHRPVSLAAASVLLPLSLVAVVVLSKTLAPSVEGFLTGIGAPRSSVAILIAVLVLLPETLTALAAASADQLQKSLNVAFGSALASIGLTIPVVAVISLAMHSPIALGIDGLNTVLLSLTLLVGTLTFSTGRTTVLQGAVHLSLFATYIFLSMVPD
jgi:Ca2+:H+ antiporter